MTLKILLNVIRHFFYLRHFCHITTFYERQSVCFVTSLLELCSDVTFNVACELSQPMDKTISIFHGCMVWIEKSVTRVTDRHDEACRVMPNSDPE